MLYQIESIGVFNVQESLTQMLSPGNDSMHFVTFGLASLNFVAGLSNTRRRLFVKVKAILIENLTRVPLKWKNLKIVYFCKSFFPTQHQISSIVLYGNNSILQDPFSSFAKIDPTYKYNSCHVT